MPRQANAADTLAPASGASEDGFCGTTQAAKLLGLSVATVQSLVERGDIEAWKTRGGHRRISLRSVNQYLRKYSARSPASRARGGERLRVLVVEDDADLLDLYRAVFDDWKLAADFTFRASALEALVELSSVRPDLLITDLSMPGVDGFEMLKVLKRNEQLAGMRVLVASGLSRQAIAARGGVPADALILSKPLNFDWLHGYVSALVADRQAQV